MLSPLPAVPASASQVYNILDIVKIALKQSDTALSLADDLVIEKMNIASAEHRFAIQLIPLANIGVAQGTGSQTLGYEVQRETSSGSSLTAGFRVDRTDLDEAYEVEDEVRARAYIKISQGLFRRWGTRYNLAGLNAAELSGQSKQLQTVRSRQFLILNTVRRYYNVVLAGKLLEKSEQALGRSRENLEESIARQSVGLVSKVDVYRAELALLTAENSHRDQQRNQQRAIESLNEQLGLFEAEQLRITEEVNRLVPVIPDDWEQNLLDYRLDWQEHLIDLKKGRISLYRAERNMLPDLALSATLEQAGGADSIEEIDSLDETNWSVQVELRSTFDLFDEKQALTRENIKIAQLHRNGKALRRKIMREAREAFENLQTEEHRHRISVAQLKQAGKAMDLAQTRYNRGLSDNLDMIDAENSFSQAELDIITALTGYNLQAVELAYALGILDLDWLRLATETFL